MSKSLINEWTTAQYEDSVSTTPINLSVSWLSHNWLRGVLSLFFRAKSHIISSLLFWQILIRQLNWGKTSDQPPYLTTQLTLLSVFQLNKFQFFSTSPPSTFQLGELPPTIFWLGGQIPVIYCQIKLRIINQYGRSENQERLIQIYLDSTGSEQVQGTSAGTKVLVLCRVQMKERSLFSFPSLVAKSVSWKKNAQCESCELSFIWGKMRTITQETAFQIALRNCSKEVGGKISIYVILVKWKYMQSSTYAFQKVSADLMKVTASHGEQTSSWRILVLF